MKKESMRKYSLLGLVLVAASAVTAAVLPKNEDKKQTGGLIASNSGGQLTCSRDAAGAACNWTATTDGTDGGAANDNTRSRTTTNGNGTSSITTANGNNKAVTNTDGEHTSQN